MKKGIVTVNWDTICSPLENGGLKIIVPAGWPGSYLCVACPRELRHLRSALSVSTWKEVNKGAPSQPFALRRSSQLARNIKRWHTSVSEHREGMFWRWLNNTEWLILCALIACAHSGCAVKQLGFLALCKLWELCQNSDHFPTSQGPFLYTSHI